MAIKGDQSPMKLNKLFFMAITGLAIMSIMFFSLIQNINTEIQNEARKLSENVATTHDVTQPYLEHFRFRETLTKYAFQLNGITPKN